MDTSGTAEIIDTTQFLMDKFVKSKQHISKLSRALSSLGGFHSTRNKTD